jgi:hypothetical protein
LGHITLDNAENNATAMVELESLLKSEGIKFSAKENRIPCYAHIINICVSHIVSSLPKVGADDLEEDDEAIFSDDESVSDDDGGFNGDDLEDADDTDNTDNTSFTNAEWSTKLQRNPLKRARAVVRTVRASGQRKDEFLAAIKKGNRNGTFSDQEGNVVLVKELQLIKDVRHRWNSLFNMLERLEELRYVCQMYT